MSWDGRPRGQRQGRQGFFQSSVQIVLPPLPLMIMGLADAGLQKEKLRQVVCGGSPTGLDIFHFKVARLNPERWKVDGKLGLKSAQV